MSDLRLVSNQDALKSYRGYKFAGIKYPQFVLKDFIRDLRKENLLVFNQPASDDHVGLVQELYGCGAKAVVDKYNLAFQPANWRVGLGLVFRLPCTDCGKWFSFLPFSIAEYRANEHNKLKKFPGFLRKSRHKYTMELFEFFSDLVRHHHADEEHLRDFPFCENCFWEEHCRISDGYVDACQQEKLLQEAAAKKERNHAEACMAVLNRRENHFCCLEESKLPAIMMLKMVAGAASRYGVLVNDSITPMIRVKDRVDPGEYDFITNGLRVLVNEGVLRAVDAIPGAFEGAEVVKTNFGPELTGQEKAYEQLTVKYKNLSPGLTMTPDTLNKYSLNFGLILAYEKHYKLLELYDVLEESFFDDLRDFAVEKSKEIGLDFVLSAGNHEAIVYLHKNFGVAHAFSIVVYVLRSVAYDLARKEVTKKTIERSLGTMFKDYGRAAVRLKIGPMHKNLLNKHFSLGDLRPLTRGLLMDVLKYTEEEIYTRPRSTNQMREDVGLCGRLRKSPKMVLGEGDTPLFPGFEG